MLSGKPKGFCSATPTIFPPIYLHISPVTRDYLYSADGSDTALLKVVRALFGYETDMNDDERGGWKVFAVNPLNAKFLVCKKLSSAQNFQN